MKRLHIVGCPRSGTTLIKELLCTCFSHDGSCEHEMSIFQQPENQGDLFISKQPNDIRQLRHVFSRDDALFIIYMGRDPRAVITSRHRSRPGEYFCNYRVWHECDVAARDYMGHPRFLALRYEDLVNGPDRVQNRIRTHFPFLQQQHQFSEFLQHADPSAESRAAMHELRQINTQSLDKWRGHLSRVAEQYQRWPGMAQDLVRLGYEADETWLEALREVKAEIYPCRYPEHRQHLKELEKSLRVYLKSRRYLRRRA